ncbi:hypothetical protein Egran_00062 [Elaphomyces granulatus]|uniref:Uncharacterized protein n=1 Tax=Elaphomyces granulatus TaxID=519963 RepID=A0A232M7W2_9EURO|nr:hypothetical protein Egran_00062 [Elaphomyces granulatus]
MAGVGVLTLVETLANIVEGTYMQAIKKIMLAKHADNEQLVDETLLSEHDGHWQYQR